jgi:hypothetical protein
MPKEPNNRKEDPAEGSRETIDRELKRDAGQKKRPVPRRRERESGGR